MTKSGRCFVTVLDKKSQRTIRHKLSGLRSQDSNNLDLTLMLVQVNFISFNGSYHPCAHLPNLFGPLANETIGGTITHTV